MVIRTMQEYYSIIESIHFEMINLKNQPFKYNLNRIHAKICYIWYVWEFLWNIFSLIRWTQFFDFWLISYSESDEIVEIPKFKLFRIHRSKVWNQPLTRNQFTLDSILLSECISLFLKIFGYCFSVSVTCNSFNAIEVSFY